MLPEEIDGRLPCSPRGLKPVDSITQEHRARAQIGFTTNSSNVSRLLDQGLPDPQRGGRDPLRTRCELRAVGISEPLHILLLEVCPPIGETVAVIGRLEVLGPLGGVVCGPTAGQKDGNAKSCGSNAHQSGP
jgi:hypothetical protein